MKILIAGDSFSATQNPFVPWFQLAFSRHKIVNIARAGAGNFFIADSVQHMINSNNFKKIIVFWSSVYRYDAIVENSGRSMVEIKHKIKDDSYFCHGHVGGKLYMFSAGPANESYLKEYIKDSENIKSRSIEKIISTNAICEQLVGKENYKFGFSITPDVDVIKIFENENNFVCPSMMDFGEQVQGIANGYGYPLDGHFDQKGHEKFAEYIKKQVVDRS